MRLSKLQKYILLQCFDKKYSKLDRKGLVKFYNSYKKKPGSAEVGPKKEIQVNSITGSLDRLMKKGVLVGFGEITKTKIFIEKVRLTAQGRKTAKKLLGEQRRLPLKLKKKK